MQDWSSPAASNAFMKEMIGSANSSKVGSYWLIIVSKSLEYESARVGLKYMRLVIAPAGQATLAVAIIEIPSNT